MSGSRTSRYAWGAGGAALGVGAILAALAAMRGISAPGWSLAGWGLMAATGVAGGVWIVSRHGDPGPGFLVAVGTCMLARLFAGAALTVAAAAAGMSAVWAFLTAATATYVVLQLFEVSWFLRHPQPIE